MHINLALSTKLKVTPQLIFANKLLQTSGEDVEKLILQKLAENPALEMVNQHQHSVHSPRENSFQLNNRVNSRLRRSGGGTSTNSFQDPHKRLENLAMQTTAIEQLIAQARLMVERHDLELAVFLLHSLDEHGYLRTSPEELAAEFGTITEAVKHVIQILHQLDPPGIGARDLQECLLIQCAHFESEGADCHLIRRMLVETWDDFISHRWQYISRRLKVTSQEIDRARHFISQHCYPYPLHLLEDSLLSSGAHGCADLIIHREPENDAVRYVIDIPASDAFELRISASFQNALQSTLGANLSEEERAWTYDSIEQARLFIIALNQRWTTLRRIGEFLVAYQTDFLERGPLYMKPLTRTAVARELNLHESTIGRAVRDKVAQLPNGRLIPLTQFFDDSLAIKEAIRQLLIRANEPLNDREIANQLESAGFNLARRTITKYRQQLNVLPAHQRQSADLLGGIPGR
jgi:RNA polymerase sigma-54 factor